MTDSIGAELYGILFEVLAQDPNEENKALAKRFFKLIDESDFSYSQMNVDEALITLSLAKRRLDLEGEQTVLYFGEKLKAE